MRNLLIKIAYKILSHYGMEDLPMLYHNGIRYYVRSYDLHISPDEANTLTIVAEDSKNGTWV